MTDKHWCRWDEHDCEAAYDEIERLRSERGAGHDLLAGELVKRDAEIERLRAALEIIAWEDNYRPDIPKTSAREFQQVARRALEPKP